MGAECGSLWARLFVCEFRKFLRATVEPARDGRRQHYRTLTGGRVMLRRTWNAFLDAVESVIEFVDYLTGSGPSKFDADSRKPEPRG
jgi:hypothetical protein